MKMCRTCQTMIPVEHRLGRKRVYCSSCAKKRLRSQRTLNAKIWKQNHPDWQPRYFEARSKDAAWMKQRAERAKAYRAKRKALLHSQPQSPLAEGPKPAPL